MSHRPWAERAKPGSIVKRPKMALAFDPLKNEP
jgi:hypothetical protein